MKVSPEIKDLLVEIVDRYMTTFRPTSHDRIRTRLMDKTAALRELVNASVLAAVTGWMEGEKGQTVYYPRLLAFEYIGDAVRRKFANRELTSVLHKAKELVLSSDNLTVDVPINFERIPDQGQPCVALWLADFSHLVDNAEFIQSTEGFPKYLRVTFTSLIRSFENAADSWAVELQRRKIEPVPLSQLHPSPQGNTRSQMAANPLTVVFDFMKDAALKNITIRDYGELHWAIEQGATKMQFVLIGGIMEALLLDALMQDLSAVQSTSASRKERRSLDEWGLGSLIDAAVEIGIISNTAQSFGHAIREFRNFVHPGLELRSTLRIDREELEIAQTVLRVVIRDLEKRSQPHSTAGP